MEDHADQIEASVPRSAQRQKLPSMVQTKKKKTWVSFFLAPFLLFILHGGAAAFRSAGGKKNCQDNRTDLGGGPKKAERTREKIKKKEKKWTSCLTCNNSCGTLLLAMFGSIRDPRCRGGVPFSGGFFFAVAGGHSRERLPCSVRGHRLSCYFGLTIMNPRCDS